MLGINAREKEKRERKKFQRGKMRNFFLQRLLFFNRQRTVQLENENLFYFILFYFKPFTKKWKMKWKRSKNQPLVLLSLHLIRV